MDREQILANINRAREALAEAREGDDASAIARCTVDLKSAVADLEAHDALNPITRVAPRSEAPVARSFAGAEGVDEWIARTAAKEFGSVTIERGDIFTGTGTTGALDIIVPDTDPVIDQRPRRALSFYDHIRFVPTESDTVKWFQETGFVSAAAGVARRAGEPSNYGKYQRSSITIVPKSAPVAKVGHSVRTDEDTLADRPGVQDLLNVELPYAVREAIMAHLLAATDTPNSIPSIAVTGVNRAQSITYTVVPGDEQATAMNLLVAVRKAKTAARVAGYPATWAAFSAVVDEALELLRSSTGVFIAGNPFQSQDASTVWGLSRTIVDALGDGTEEDEADVFGWGRVVVGQSNTWRARPRTGVEISSSANVDDDFERDAVVIKARQRLAIENRRPEGIVVITPVLAPVEDPEDPEDPEEP